MIQEEESHLPQCSIEGCGHTVTNCSNFKSTALAQVCQSVTIQICCKIRHTCLGFRSSGGRVWAFAMLRPTRHTCLLETVPSLTVLGMPAPPRRRVNWYATCLNGAYAMNLRVEELFSSPSASPSRPALQHVSSGNQTQTSELLSCMCVWQHVPFPKHQPYESGKWPERPEGRVCQSIELPKASEGNSVFVIPRCSRPVALSISSRTCLNQASKAKH